MIKYLLLLVFVTSLQAQVIKHLSEEPEVTTLAPTDLIATSTQPGTGFEHTKKMQYGNIKTQLFTNPISQDLVNYFQGIRAPLWVLGSQNRTTLVYTNDQPIITLRQRGDASDPSNQWNRVIYFGGTTPFDIDAVSFQAYGGVAPGQGNPRISFVLGDDAYTWRFREYNLEDGGQIDGVYHSILQHNNLGDVLLGGMGARNLFVVSPGAIGNGNSVVITVDNTKQGLASYTFTAGTHFLTNGNSAAVAASLATSISNVFTDIDWNNQLLVNYLPAHTNIQIVPLTGTKNISITVPTGITYTATTNGTTTAMGVIIGDGSGLTNITVASNQVFVAAGVGITGATNVSGGKVTYTLTGNPTNIVGNGFKSLNIAPLAQNGTNYVIDLAAGAIQTMTNEVNTYERIVHITNGPGQAVIRFYSPSGNINYVSMFPTNWHWLSTNGMILSGGQYTNAVFFPKVGILTIQAFGPLPTDVAAEFKISPNF